MDAQEQTQTPPQTGSSNNKQNSPILKDVPKPFVALVEAYDETDRIEYDNDEIVQVKNEVNTKVNAENESNIDLRLSLPYKDDQWSPSNNAESESNIIDLRPSLPYKDDQWSPSNTTGKKIYDRDFLLALRNDPKSRIKPDNLLEAVAQENRGRVGDFNRYPLDGKPTDFTPTFSGSNYIGKSMSSQRSTLLKRNSRQVHADVKLNESENPWKPARFVSSTTMSDDDKKTQELNKKVRGILNKLTPQKFDTLLVQVRALTIDTKERLQGVIDLVFKKAVNEPIFSEVYALMCKELALVQVPNNSKRDGDSVNFRKLLVTGCQLEFEKNSVDKNARNAKVKEIEECTDPEKKKELQLLLEEDDRRIRRKSVGNIRFIGELFKQHMLTANIMIRCLNHLLINKDEESLECLCKLLSAIGKDLEEKKVDLGSIFHIIREIVDKKYGKVSRVRCMLQNVIDLRNSKWIPRRQHLNQKTAVRLTVQTLPKQNSQQGKGDCNIKGNKSSNAIKSISEDGDVKLNESENIWKPARFESSATMSDNEKNQAINAAASGSNNTSDQEGWSTASSLDRTPFSVQSDKLKNKPPQVDEPLGSSQMFGSWTRESNIKPNTQTPSTGNMYAALENMGNDVDKRSALTAPKPRQPPAEQITPEQLDQLERKIKNILEEYLNDCHTVDECDEDIRTSLPPSALPKLVSESYILVLEKSRTARLGTGSLFANLIKRFTLSIDNYCAGLEEVLSQADGLTIDNPKIWDYLAEIIAPIINENAVPLLRLHKSFDIIKQGHAPKLLHPLFKLVIGEEDPNYLRPSLQQNSGLSSSNFMKSSQVNNFIQENQLEFLGGKNTVVSQSELTYEQIHKKLLEFFANDNSLDDIFRWIEANIGDRVREKQFVRTLATAVFEDSIVKSKLKTENLRKHYSLLIRTVDGHLDYEVECLYALQALINKLEHPQGILLLICGSLYEDSVFSHDSFVKWETSDNPAEQEGKGVAVKQLASFFTQLKEADEDTSSTDDG